MQVDRLQRAGWARRSELAGGEGWDGWMAGVSKLEVGLGFRTWDLCSGLALAVACLRAYGSCACALGRGRWAEQVEGLGQDRTGQEEPSLGWLRWFSSCCKAVSKYK